jgi:hypothetical protein
MLLTEAKLFCITFSHLHARRPYLVFFETSVDAGEEASQIDRSKLDPRRFVARRPGCFDKPVALLRLLRYSAEASSPESGILGCGAHSDYGMLTLLATDHVPGLQININGEWIDVPPRSLFTPILFFGFRLASFSYSSSFVCVC